VTSFKGCFHLSRFFVSLWPILYTRVSGNAAQILLFCHEARGEAIARVMAGPEQIIFGIIMNDWGVPV